MELEARVRHSSNQIPALASLQAPVLGREQMGVRLTGRLLGTIYQTVKAILR